MDATVERTARAYIRDWARRSNSGAGNRRKSTKTAQKTTSSILSFLVNGENWAVDHIAWCVAYDTGYRPTVEEIQSVAKQMAEGAA